MSPPPAPPNVPPPHGKEIHHNPPAHLTHPQSSEINHPQPGKKGVDFHPDVKKQHPHESSNEQHQHKSTKVPAHDGDNELDLSGEFGKRYFCKKLNTSLTPLSTLLSLVGRFPLTNSCGLDGVFEYKASHATMSGLLFNIMTILLLYTLIVGVYNVMVVLLNIPTPFTSAAKRETESFQKQLMYDKALIQRNSIPLIIVFTTILQGLLTSIFFSRKMEYLAHIFSFMNKAAYTLHMDIAGNVANFSLHSTVIGTIATCGLIMAVILKFGPSAVGTPAVFGSLLVRLFLGSRNWFELHSSSGRTHMQMIGGFCLIMTFIASISPMLLFIYKCKLLKNAFACWNGRAYYSLLRGLEHAQTEEARTTYALLFKDHCVMLDLLDGIDEMYAFTIETFFCLQSVSLFFQLYFFFYVGTRGPAITSSKVLVGNNSKLAYIRPYDWFPTLIILCCTVSLLYATGKAAANVGEEAQAGFEVLRRKGMIGRKTDQELEFMLSMSSSFESYIRIEVSGAGYLYYNKAFMIQLGGVTLLCFMILCQFRPALDHVLASEENTYKTTGTFLKYFEGTSNDQHGEHWENDQLWEVRYI